MQPGQDRSSWCLWLVGPVFGLLAGCTTSRSQLEQSLRAAAPARPDPAAHYAVHCPDVLTLDVPGHPECSGRRQVGPDGRIELGEEGLRVDGQTAPEIARAVAQLTGMPPEGVGVRVAEFNGQQLYLFGEVRGLQRAVPYQGPETVLDLLRRVGGVTPGAAVGDVQVIRPHVADGKAPEIFHVDLAAIVLKNDPQTNVRLEPFDQVYIGKSRRSCFACCLPPWLQPVYKALFGMRERP